MCEKFSVLTGGPGCGKTTTTLVIVKLLEAMKRKVLLAAPTGRAAQRMMDVIGNESKTIHRLLEWQIGQFKKNEENPLDVDFIIVDECSMLDINLTASLLKAIPPKARSFSLAMRTNCRLLAPAMSSGILLPLARLPVSTEKSFPAGPRISHYPLCSSDQQW